MLVHGGAVIHPNKLLTELMDRPIFAFVRVESLWIRLGLQTYTLDPCALSKLLLF